MTRVQRAHARRRAMSQDGFGAYWLAITCVLILAAGALAVDLGYAYVENQRTQDAADAAALGGTIFLPSDPTLASARAQQLAIENGFDPSDPNVHISVTPVAGQLTQLKVTITKRIPVFFAGILGYDHMTITRTATADYDQPVQMGSPASSFGNQPDCAGQCTSGDPTPDFWANVEGPQTFKHNGNAFMGGYCTGGISDNCAGEGLNNSDLQSDGAVFAIRNRVPGSAVRIDLFDAPFVNVGDVCPDTDPNSGGPSALAVLAAFLGNNPRYTPGAWPQSQYCTGDVLIPTPASSQPVVTQYRVFQPDATPWTLADNVPESACPTLTFTGAADAISGYIDPTTQAAWRQWYTMCTISNPVAGDYMLQVRTLSGAGNNNFSVRVASGGSLSSSNVSVFGQGRMAIYANSAAGQNNTTFYFARVLPGAAGRFLTLDFFDTGDAPNNSVGTLRVLPPADATTGSGALTAFKGCTYTPPPGSSSGPPWGLPVATPDTAGPCSVGGVSSATYNGQWVEWQIPIPDDYACDYNNPFGCWIRINFGFNNGVRDVTSWRATLDGNPVRLVQ